MTEVIVEETGIVVSSATVVIEQAMAVLLDTARVLMNVDAVREIKIASATVAPLSVDQILVPPFGDVAFISRKLAAVIASGSTCVIRHSEGSAIQCQMLAMAFHAAHIPNGVINFVSGRTRSLGAARLPVDKLTK